MWLLNQSAWGVESSDPAGRAGNPNGAAYWSETFSHIYGPGDNGTYSFRSWGNTTIAEFAGMLVGYRGADQNLSDYTAWGYGIYGDTSLYQIGPVAPYRPATLLNIFIGPQSEADEEESIGVTFSAPGGPSSPQPTVETPLSQLIPFLAADVGVPTANQSVGPYYDSEVDNGTGYFAIGVWAGFQIAIPP